MRTVGLLLAAVCGVVACGQSPLQNLVAQAPSAPTAPKTPSALTAPAASSSSDAPKSAQPGAPGGAVDNSAHARQAQRRPRNNSSQPVAPGGNGGTTTASSSQKAAPASGSTSTPAPAPKGPDPNELVPKVAALASPAPGSLPKNPADAQAKCDAGVYRACAILADFLWYGRRGTTDAPKAENLYKTACAAGEPTACAGWANEVMTGKIDQHDARIVNLEAWACANGSGYGCWLAGDSAKAGTLYKAECDAGYLGSCDSLAHLYVDGSGVPQDDGQAVALFRKACAGGDAEGCDFLAGKYEDGSGVVQNDSTAKAFYTQACTMGSKNGCDDLATLVADRRSRGFEIP